MSITASRGERLTQSHKQKQRQATKGSKRLSLGTLQDLFIAHSAWTHKGSYEYYHGSNLWVSARNLDSLTGENFKRRGGT